MRIYQLKVASTATYEVDALQSGRAHDSDDDAEVYAHEYEASPKRRGGTHRERNGELSKALAAI